MSDWKDFEIECTEYLNNRFKMYADFIHQGGSDSTVPDILVQAKNGQNFYIDAKFCPAQCGQFVLLPDIETQSFVYSKKNSNKINNYSEIIINHMNTSFDEYREAGTAGKDIIFSNCSEIFSKWIINAYKDKYVRFFITNEFIILPIENFNDYFDVTAKYRIKRSGSSSIGKSKIKSVSEYIRSLTYTITFIRQEGNKLYVTSNENLHNERFLLHGFEYMFSLRENEYEIRKLSNTYNANVIFSIKNKNNKEGISETDFIDKIK